MADEEHEETLHGSDEETDNDDNDDNEDEDTQAVFDGDVDLSVHESTEPPEDPCDHMILNQLDESGSDSHSHVVTKSSIRTSQYITKYEKTRSLGWRSQQLTSGAPPMIQEDEKINGEYVFEDQKYPIDTYKIAEMELMYGRLPIIIGRRLPNGEKFLISVSKLKLI
jgi:DNA-directed RNA polymerase subunit K/omega